MQPTNSQQPGTIRVRTYPVGNETPRRSRIRGRLCFGGASERREAATQDERPPQFRRTRTGKRTIETSTNDDQHMGVYTPKYQNSAPVASEI
jgi:hypothetical protein